MLAGVGALPALVQEAVPEEGFTAGDGEAWMRATLAQQQKETDSCCCGGRNLEQTFLLLLQVKAKLHGSLCLTGRGGIFDIG